MAKEEVIEKIAQELLYVWKEAKSMETNDWNDMEWCDLSLKEKGEYLKTATRLYEMCHSPLPDSEGLLGDEENNQLIIQINEAINKRVEMGIATSKALATVIMDLFDQKLEDINARCQAHEADAVRKAKQEERERIFTEIENFLICDMVNGEEKGYWLSLETVQALKEGK